MPIDINQLVEGWLELESDPGLFTLLLEDFGVKGVQVDEIYDLQKPMENPVYGFIFLFRWTEDRRSRRKVVDKGNVFVRDEELVNNLFFAQQMVPNSCASHALLSVLLNCPKIHLGETLTRLKTHTTGMNPENKGWAIGNTPELAKAHNSHAVPRARPRQDKTGSISTGRCVADTYHFVSYVPVNGRLFELDGLKPYPIDHGPWGENEDWTEKFRAVIKERLGVAKEEANSDICYNLMAVVPDKRLGLTHKLNLLRTNRQIVLDALQQLVQNTQTNSLLHESETKSLKRLSPSKEADEKNSLETSSKSGSFKKEKSDESVGQCKSKILESNCNPKLIVTPPKHAYQADDTKGMPEQDCSNNLLAGNEESLVNSQQQAQEKDSNNACNNNFVVIRVSVGDTNQDSEQKDSKFRKVCLEAGALPIGWEKSGVAPTATTASITSPVSAEKKSETVERKTESPQLHHTFSPKDLLALVKNLEVEISSCEGLLRDENEKRKQYKIDDCRRTHNYDQFICTFLSMLAEQGKLADLVQQHLTNSVPGQRKPPTSNQSLPIRSLSTSKARVATSNSISSNSLRRKTRCRKS